MPALRGGRQDCVTEQCAFLPLRARAFTMLMLTVHSRWGGRCTDAIKERRTFANVVVELVPRGAGDRPLAHVAPRRIHAALVQLAGVRGQTLVYVCCSRREATKASKGVRRRTLHCRGGLTSEGAVLSAEISSQEMKESGWTPLGAGRGGAGR